MKALSKNLFILAFLSLAAIEFEARAAIAIVTNSNNAVNAINIDDVKKIYRGKTRTFPNNLPAIPIDQDSDTEAYQEFLTKVIEKSVKEIKAFWSVKIFTGRGTPPPQLDTDKLVKEWLQKNPEGIGYINLNSVDSSVKVILKVP